MKDEMTCELTCKYARKCKHAGAYEAADDEELSELCKYFRDMHRTIHDDRKERNERRKEKWYRNND